MAKRRKPLLRHGFVIETIGMAFVCVPSAFMSDNGLRGLAMTLAIAVGGAIIARGWAMRDEERKADFERRVDQEIQRRARRDAV